ncbi:MAG: hypothetical protein LBO06_06465 [Bacteroidales bacterium]|jgi:hypothetical protein|nr:hypothetical protein [Bacteroidales bacterium]
MKKVLLSLAVVLSLAFSTSAQESSFTTGADFQSRYLWRGLQLGGNTPSIQPAATFSWNGLSVGVWGAFQTMGLTNQELDITIGYTFANDMLTAQVTDYCFPYDRFDLTAAPVRHHYFDYNEGGSHTFEAGIKFNGLESLPLRAEVYVNFYNDDDYSTYAEISYNPTIEKWGLDLNVFAGCVFTQSIAYSTEGFGLINLGAGITKKLKITDSFTLPVYTRLIFNPDADKAYFVIGTGFSI